MPTKNKARGRSSVMAGGTALTALAGIDGIDIGLLEHLDPDIAAATISATLTRHRLETTADSTARARLHQQHGTRLANAGRLEEALREVKTAADVHRRLAATDPTTHLP